LCAWTFPTYNKLVFLESILRRPNFDILSMQYESGSWNFRHDRRKLVFRSKHVYNYKKSWKVKISNNSFCKWNQNFSYFTMWKVNINIHNFFVELHRKIVFLGSKYFCDPCENGEMENMTKFYQINVGISWINTIGWSGQIFVDEIDRGKSLWDILTTFAPWPRSLKIAI
jgi:hypothetical protein